MTLTRDTRLDPYELTAPIVNVAPDDDDDDFDDADDDDEDDDEDDEDQEGQEDPPGWSD